MFKMTFLKLMLNGGEILFLLPEGQICHPGCFFVLRKVIWASVAKRLSSGVNGSSLLVHSLKLFPAKH